MPMIELTTTKGALDDAAKQWLAAQLSTIALELEAALVKRVTEAVLAAEGSANTMVEAHRVWVHLRSIADGHWAGFGEVVTLREVAAYGMNTDKPGSKIDRMRRAAMASIEGAGPVEAPADF